MNYKELTKKLRHLVAVKFLEEAGVLIESGSTQLWEKGL
jgi:hypothetical protein